MSEQGPFRLSQFLGPTYHAPGWLVAVFAGFAALGIIDEFATGPTFVGVGATAAFLLLHLSWPVVLRSPALGTATCLLGCVGAVLYLDRVGVATMSAMIILVATAALSKPVVAVTALVGFLGWSGWTTAYFAEESRVFWGQALLLILSAAAGTFIRIVVFELVIAKRRLRRAQERADQARRDERLAIARELHDIVAHELTLISLQSASRLRSDDPQVLREVLTQIGDTSRSALTELRVLLGVLRWEDGEKTRPQDDQSLSTLGLPEAIDSLVEKVSSVGFSVETHFEIEEWESLQPSTRQAIFRIAQEALTNVSKHAPPGSRCRFEVKMTQERINVLVESDISSELRLDPLDPSLSSGQGLIGISERAAALGGSSSAGPESGRWVVRASVPL